MYHLLDGLLLGGGAIAAVGLYFYYLNNKKKVDQKVSFSFNTLAVLVDAPHC